MKNAWIIGSMLFFILGCTPSETITDQIALPQKLTRIENNTIEIEHSCDTIFAIVNTKDPKKRGKYQLQFTTSVISKETELTIHEFGAYTLDDGKWKFTSIFNRPFDKREFSKWYSCKGGILKKDSVYSDADNWLTKGDILTGDTLVSLWYFVGKDSKGRKHVGTQKVVGIFDLK